jgi:predicted pyridoxine 5'-phosphate oxidase superfamily flavin-nucleotide-binding protein
MTARRPEPDGPFHPGELAVQRRAGVVLDARQVGASIGGVLPPMAGAFLRDQRVAVVASLDDAGRVWASLVTGPAGFVKAVDEGLLLVNGRIVPGDPLVRNLAARPEVGLLVIDLARRRRLRVNGRGFLEGSRVFVTVRQAYGNCPKYIHPRLVEPVQGGQPSVGRSKTLTRRQQAWVARADTLFIASYHPQGGADASHRGGDPGFVRVTGPGAALSFADFPGNNMFNTLGNIEAQPRVGLLFLDFETGGTLQLTGKAWLEWQPQGPPSATGERAIVHVDLEEVVEIAGQGLIARSASDSRAR